MMALSVQTNTYVLIYVLIAITFNSTLIFASIVLNLYLVYIIKSTSSIVTNKTLQLQLMYYRAVFFTTAFFLIFLVIPTITLALFTIDVTSSIEIGIVSLGIMPSHVPFSYVIIIGFVKPYREFVWNGILFIATKLKGRSNPPIEQL